MNRNVTYHSFVFANTQIVTPKDAQHFCQIHDFEFPSPYTCGLAHTDALMDEFAWETKINLADPQSIPEYSE